MCLHGLCLHNLCLSLLLHLPNESLLLLAKLQLLRAPAPRGRVGELCLLLLLHLLLLHLLGCYSRDCSRIEVKHGKFRRGSSWRRYELHGAHRPWLEARKLGKGKCRITSHSPAHSPTHMVENHTTLGVYVVRALSSSALRHRIDARIVQSALATPATGAPSVASCLCKLLGCAGQAWVSL